MSEEKKPEQERELSGEQLEEVAGGFSWGMSQTGLIAKDPGKAGTKLVSNEVIEGTFKF